MNHLPSGHHDGDQAADAHTTDAGKDGRWRRRSRAADGSDPDPDKHKVPLVSAVVIATIVVVGVICLVVMLIAGERDEPEAGQTPILTTPVQPPAAGTPGDTSGPCGQSPERFGVPGVDHWGNRLEQPLNPHGHVCAGEILTQTAAPGPPGTSPPPPLLTWQRIYGVAMPMSAGAGPTRISADGVPGGFAHTQQGAITAAMNIVLRSLMAPSPTTRVAVLKNNYVLPIARADIIAAAASDSATLPDNIKYAYGVPAVVRVTTYQPDFAHVQWAGGPSLEGSYVIVEADVTWVDGDWKVVYPQNTNGSSPDGQTLETLPTAEGWSEWAA